MTPESKETSSRPFSSSCVLIAASSRVVFSLVNTVALMPDNFTLVTPGCSDRTELVLVPMPHPLPETVTM